MRQHFTLKTAINFIIISAYLYSCWRLFYLIGVEQSPNTAIGFLLGLIYMAMLFVLLKCINFLYKDAQTWLAENTVKGSKTNKLKSAVIKKWRTYTDEN